MTKLIINADDYGYSPAINYGIIDAHRDGVVTSTTMMANMPGLEHAAKLSHDFPRLGIGVHLSLTGGAPIRSDVDSLTAPSGAFHPLSYYHNPENKIDLDQLYLEWHTQIERLITIGIDLTHIDSHHYTHAFPNHREVAERLSEHYQLPLRNCLDAKAITEKPGLYPADAFWNLFNFPEMKNMREQYPTGKEALFNRFRQEAEQHAKYEIVEGSCHPGYLDEVVWYGSSFNLARMKEMNVLRDSDFRSLLEEFGYQLINYSHV